MGRQETRSSVLGCCRFGGWPLHLGVFPLPERRRRFRGLTTLVGSVRCHPGCLTIAGLRDAGVLPYTDEPQFVPCVKRDPAGDVRARDRFRVASSAACSLWFVPERQRVEPETDSEALAEPLPFTISIALTKSVTITEPLTLSFAKPH